METKKKLTGGEKFAYGLGAVGKDMVYMLTYIDKDPNSKNVEKISNLPYCEFDRFYTSDNLNHYIFTIYY